jgi:hypothetical protein
MTKYIATGVLALGSGLTAFLWNRRKQATIVVNDFHVNGNSYEASITDRFGDTYRVYGEGITWWYKTTDEPVPNHIAKAISEFRAEYMRKIVKASLSPVKDNVIIRDGKKLVAITKE